MITLLGSTQFPSMGKLLPVLIIAGFPLASVGQTQNGQPIKEMNSVQQDLRDSKKRQELLKSDRAKQADQNVKSLGGSEANSEAIYDLAADVFGNMSGKSPEEMMRFLEEAQRNPEKFGESFTPEQRQKLRKISSEIEESRKKQP